ncbi:MAG: class I SAM-dependent methyltransferase [Actinobacteria bacterium]|nr:class I SAM-dependent methyltransferase [Actinomycetota bacterium]
MAEPRTTRDVAQDATGDATRDVARDATVAAPARELVAFDESDAAELRSAEVALPRLFEVHRPRSVLHVGCGNGAWLWWFARYGVEDCAGVDLAHPADGRTHVARNHVTLTDIREPFDLGRRFDLVVALELASRLPEYRAHIVVDNLVRHGDAILFSAAVPGQGSEHVNEQWPEYWIERFDRRGLVAVDCVRPRWWNERHISWPYRQNTFLVVSEVRLANSARLRIEHEIRAGAPIAMVHPAMWVARTAPTPLAASDPGPAVSRTRRSRRHRRRR